MKKVLLCLPLLLWCGCEDNKSHDDNNQPELSDSELSIEIVDIEFLLSWTIYNDPDFQKYILKSGTESNKISTVLQEILDSTIISYRIPYTGEEMYFQLEIINLENEMCISNVVSVNTDYPLSTDFLKCGTILHTVYEHPDSVIIYENTPYWDGLTKYIGYNEDTLIIEFNEYGCPLKEDLSRMSNSNVLERTYQYIDSWKLISYISTNINGVSTSTNYTWDGLTRIEVGNEHNFVEFNEYGNPTLLAYSWSTHPTYIYYHKDQRRPYKNVMGDYICLYIWDGLMCDVWTITPLDTTLIVTKTINEYGSIVGKTYYDYTTGEDIPLQDECIVYDCDIFLPIPLD